MQRASLQSQKLSGLCYLSQKNQRLEVGLELEETLLEVPLLAGFFAGGQEAGTGLGWIAVADGVARASFICGVEIILGAPETFAGKERVFQAGAD